MHPFPEGSFAPRNGWHVAAFCEEIGEDAFATAEIERIISTIDELPPELMLKSDATAVVGRRMLQAMMDAERAEREEQT